MEPTTNLTTENVVNTDAKDLAVVPETPKPLTRKEIGRLRRRYTTVVHSTVKACGHKFNPKTQPRTNCEACWEAYFMTAVDTAAIHDDLQKGGKAKLITVYGKVFTKMFGRFLMNELMKEAENGEADRIQVSDTNDGSNNGESNEGPYELGAAE